jgi:hypothetical protein
MVMRLPLRPFLIASALTLLAACSSSDDVSTTSSLPTTTAPVGERSSDPAAVEAPETASTVVQPEATTTTTTTTSTTVAPVEVVTDDQTIDPIFEPLLEQLKASSGVPVRLPADLDLGDDTDLAATLVLSDESGYLIYVGVGPDCNGGNVCRASTFAGSIVTTTDESDSVSVSVPLPNGLQGRFFDATCGANCGDGIVEWDEESVRYTVGQKLGTGPDMLDMAWNAIDPTADAPQRPDVCGPDLERDDGRVAAIHTDEAFDLHWLTVCSDDGISVDLVAEPGPLAWFDYDNDGSNDLAVTEENDTIAIFSLAGITSQALMDFDTFGRLRVDDLRCMDLNGDGANELIDARSGAVYEFLNPVSVTVTTTVDGAESFDRCF